MELVRLMMHCRIIPDGNLEMLKTFLSVIVIDTALLLDYLPIFTPFKH